MTDVELLPLPEHFAHQSERVQEHVRDYARANLAQLQAENARLRAERDAMAKDEERYRWLRERIAGKEHVEDEFIGHPGYALSEEMAPEIDAAIDAAMNASA